MTLLNPDLIETILGDRVDEKTRAILSLLATDDESIDEPGPEELLNTRTQERADKAASLRRRYDEMSSELSELRFRNTALANALGACPNCWGEALDCRMCAGAGSAGAFPPDPELFAAVVRPVLRKVQWPEEQSTNNEKGVTDA